MNFFVLDLWIFSTKPRLYRLKNLKLHQNTTRCKDFLARPIALNTIDFLVKKLSTYTYVTQTKREIKFGKALEEYEIRLEILMP